MTKDEQAPKPNVQQNTLYSYGITAKKKERLVYITRNNDKMGVMKSSQSLALEIDAIDADFCAFAFDARAGQLVDDATHSVHLAVDVAAINPQSS